MIEVKLLSVRINLSANSYLHLTTAVFVYETMKYLSTFSCNLVDERIGLVVTQFYIKPRGNKMCFNCSDKNGLRVHIWLKPFENYFFKCEYPGTE